MTKARGVLFITVFSVLIILLSQVFTPAPPSPNLINPKVVVRLQSIKLNHGLPLEIRGRWQLRDRRDDKVLLERDGFRGNIECDLTGPKFGSYVANRDDTYISTIGSNALRINHFSYPGELIITVQKDELQQTKLLELYLRLSLEDYVLGVICGELPSQSPNIGAALKAQAIAARTYAVWKIQNAKILRDDSRDQVFVGSDYITENARNAARATAGKVITENQKVVPGFFHRNCGGGTSNAYEADFSKSEIVALSGSQDLDCADVYQRWQHTVSASELDKLCREFKLGDSLTAINTISKDQHLRRLHVRIQGDKGHRDITGEFLRARLGLPSMIWHELMLNRDGSITVTGSGHGHGIGLCQEGAMRNAQQGLNYAAIIQHYYPRAKIETLTAELFNR